MRGLGSMRFMWFCRILTVFCLLEVSVAEDVQPLRNLDWNVPTENLDGHVELSTLDLLPRTTAATDTSAPRILSRRVIQRPIHRNSSSKINRNEHVSINAASLPSSSVRFERKTSVDELSTDISKGHFVINDGGDKHEVIDEKHRNDEVGGGLPEEKGSAAAGSEQRDKDLLQKKSYVNVDRKSRGGEHWRKVLKQIKKRPIPMSNHTMSLGSPSTEITASSIEHGVGTARSRGHRRKYLEAKWHLKPKNSLEHFKTESETTTTKSDLSLVLAATSSPSGNSRVPKLFHGIEDETVEKPIDLSSHVYLGQNDQDILFTQTGTEQDESLFEFTGVTERNIFDIENSEKQNIDHPLKKYNLTLPKSFSEEDTDDVNDMISTEITTPNKMDSVSERAEDTTDIIYDVMEESTSQYTQYDSSTGTSVIFIKGFVITSKTISNTEENLDVTETSTEYSRSSTMLDATFNVAEESTTEETVPFTTEAIVTVDPNHWYGINSDDGIIEVHPDTEKSENITEAFADKPRSTEEDTATTTDMSTDTTVDHTEEIITVDPSHWYGMTEDDGTINEVPDISNEGTLKNEVENTTEIVHMDIELSTNTNGKVTNTPGLPQVESTYRSNKALSLDKDSGLGINNRFGDELSESNTASISFTNSTGVTANSESDHTTKNYIDDGQTTLNSSYTIQGSLTTTGLDPTSFGVDGTTEHSSTTVFMDLKNSSGEIHGDKNVTRFDNGFSNIVGESITEERTKFDTSTSETTIFTTEVAYTTGGIIKDSDINRFTTVHDQISSVNNRSTEDSSSTDRSIMNNDLIPDVEYSNGTLGSTVQEIATSVGFDSSTSSPTTTDVYGARNETINSTVKDNGSPVAIQNVTDSFAEETAEADRRDKMLTESSEDSFNDNWEVLTELNIFESDEEDNDKDIIVSNSADERSENTSYQNGAGEEMNNSTHKELVRTEKEFVFNQCITAKSMMPEGQNNATLSFRQSANGDFFGNNSVFIAREILGEAANVSVSIKIEDECQYIPSDVHILAALKNEMLNFTWKSSVKTLNNSLTLVLNRNKNVYVINKIHLNILKGKTMLHQTRDINIESEIYRKSEQFRFIIDFGCQTEVTFSSLDFLRTQKNENLEQNIQRDDKQSSEKRGEKNIHMEIVIGVIIMVAIILVIVFLLIEKCRRKSIDNDKSV